MEPVAPEGQENPVNYINPTLDESLKRLSLDRDNKTTSIIHAEIAKKGRIPYSEFMGISLFGPDGYYSKGKAKIGEGDFTTSPETSELFGASIGNSLFSTWEAMSKPSVFNVVEMGAGNGTLALSLLDALKNTHPDFYEAIRYTILEYGDLIPKQQEQLKDNEKVRWVQGSASQLPLANIEGAFISNELPDAFPVEVVKRVNGELRQKYITVDRVKRADSGFQRWGATFDDDRWRIEWDSPSAEVTDYVSRYGVAVAEGIEEPINLNAEKWQRQIDQVLRKGVIITVDYGRNGTIGKKSATRLYGDDPDIAPPLPDYFQFSRPGIYDITSDVNFQILERIATQDGLKVVFSGKQGDYLLRNGITEMEESKVSAQNIHSFADILHTSQEIASDSSLVDEDSFGNFYAHMLAKDIEVSLPPQAEGEKDFGRMHPVLKLGKPSEQVNVEGKEVALDQNGFLPYKLIDGDRTVDLPSYLHEFFLRQQIRKVPFEIKSADGTIIFSGRNMSQINTVLKNSGFDFQIEDAQELEDFLTKK